MKVAFSTVACPTWTLEEVADHAERLGFMGVELRTFADAPSQFACEPALTDASKVRSMFDKAGVEIACLATSLRFEPPYVGFQPDAVGLFVTPALEWSFWPQPLAPHIHCAQSRGGILEGPERISAPIP